MHAIFFYHACISFDINFILSTFQVIVYLRPIGQTSHLRCVESKIMMQMNSKIGFAHLL